MKVQETHLDGLLLITSKVHSDSRGFFCETFKNEPFDDWSFADDPEDENPLNDYVFVQDNLAHSKTAGTVRGLHYQTDSYAQAKLVSVLSGSVLDVAVDLRPGSRTFGMHGWFKLQAIGRHPYCHMLLVPRGFAHGYQTLEDESLVFYKVDNPYAPGFEAGIRWDDPDLNIEWPIVEEAILSEKDSQLPLFREVF